MGRVLYSDSDLSDRFSAGDENVVLDILYTYGPKAQRSISKKIGNSISDQDFEEILSEATAKLLHSRNSYVRTKSEVGVYFYFIVKNCVSDFLRRRSKEIHLGDSVDEIPDQSTQNITGRSGDSQLIIDLKASLSKLDESSREILMADLVSENGVETSTCLSAKLGIARSSVRVYRTRARRKLRQLMTALGHFLEKTE